MLHIAIKMLMGDRPKYVGLLMGIAFTAFLVTFAASYFAGFMTRGFALIAENSEADVWVMDAAVESAELTTNMPDSALARVRNVRGVRFATPLRLGNVNARFPNGRFQNFDVIGVDDATLMGAPSPLNGGLQTVLHAPDAVVVDAGGTRGKLQTPLRKVDQWPPDGVHLDVPTRDLVAGDELQVEGRRVKVAGRSETLPRFPPRPLMYTTYSNAGRILPREQHSLTFVLVAKQPDVTAEQLARRIEAQTGLRARSSDEFKEDTVRWYLVNSEDVGDMTAMLILAMTVGFGTTGIMLYMFTYENLRQYALLKAMGASIGTLRMMILMQACISASIGTGLGLGVCAIVGEVVARMDFPFRLMWFGPVLGMIGVLIVSLTAAAVSIRPVLRLAPGVVFAGR